MKRFVPYTAGALTLLALALPVHAQQNPPPTPPVSANASPADKALTSANDEMYQGKEGLLSGNADQDFAAMLLQHEKGDLALAQVELQYGSDPALRAAAQRMVVRRTADIGHIEDWQREHPLAAATTKSPPLAQ